MRGTAVVIFIAAIYLLAAQAAPHDGDDDDDYGDHHHPAAPTPTVPANGTPESGNPKVDYSATVKEHGDMDMGDFGMGGKEGTDGMDMDDGMDGMGHGHPAHKHNVSAPISPDEMSYWLWPEHRGLLYAHISIMTVSWGFLLPVGKLPHSAPPSHSNPLFAAGD
jgi:hypothetical protein